MSANLSLFLELAAMQGFFFSAVQVYKSRLRDRRRVLLGFITALFSVSLIESAMWMNESIYSYVHLAAVSMPLPLIFGPLFYLYIRQSINPGKQDKYTWLHFVPFCLYAIYYLQFYVLPASLKADLLTGVIPFSSPFRFRLDPDLVFSLKTISLLTYAVLSFFEFRQVLSFPKVRQWFFLVTSAFCIYLVAYVLFNVLESMSLIPGCSDYGIATSMSFFLLAFSWLGAVQPGIFEGLGFKDALVRKKYTSSQLSDKAAGELHQALIELMSDGKFYKTENLGLDQLAGKLGTNRHELSRIINEREKKSFYEFINSWRIHEAVELLRGKPRKDLNIIGIAYEVGFTNKVSFNKAFKKITGLTPGDYRRQSAGNNGENLLREDHKKVNVDQD